MQYYIVPASDIGYLPKELITFDMMTPGSKVLYAFITMLIAENGYTQVTNKFFAEQLSVTPATIKRWMDELKAWQLIKVTTLKKGMEWERTIRLAIE